MAERFTRASEIGDSLTDWGSFLTACAEDGTPGRTTRPDGTLIRGELDQTQFDLISIDSPGHLVERTAAHVAETPTRHVFMVQLRGESLLRLDGGHAPLPLNSGDVGYWTSDLTYRWEFSGPLTILTLRAPLDSLDVAASALRPLVGHSFPSDRGLARFILPFAEGVLTDPYLIQGRTGTRLVQHIVSLFTTMLLGELPAAGLERTHPSFLRITDFINDRLGDHLDPGRVAEANDMSARTVQSLFQERGTTFTEWIRRRRLESARIALADPMRASLSISQIASSLGFADHAHFSRAFRTYYSETPSTWRSRSLDRI